MPALVWFALLIDAPAAPLITPFGWLVLIGAALVLMTPGFIRCAIVGRLP